MPQDNNTIDQQHHAPILQSYGTTDPRPTKQVFAVTTRPVSVFRRSRISSATRLRSRSRSMSMFTV